MYKVKVLSVVLALLMVLSMFPIISVTGAAEDASTHALYCGGTGTTSYIDGTYGDNISLKANLRFTESINGEMSAVLLKTDSIYYKFFANSTQIGISKYINNSVSQTETFSCSLSKDFWYSLNIQVCRGNVIAKIGDTIEVVFKDSTTALTGGQIGFGGTAKYAIDNIAVEELTGVPTFYEDSDIHDGSNFTVPVNAGKNYRLDFIMNVQSYNSDNWGIAARITLRDGLILHFMKDALAIQGVGSDYTYTYDDSLKRGNHLNENVKASIVLNENSMEIYMDGALAYSVTSDNLNRNSCPVTFSSWDATWTASNVKMTAVGCEKTVYENAPSQNADFAIDNTMTNYILEFNMNVASFNSSNWGIAARVKLKEGLVLHFMNDALAVDAGTGYDYSWDEPAKIGNFLNTNVPVKVILNDNSVTVFMSGSKVYSKTKAEFEKTSSSIVFSAWDVTWAVSGVKVTDYKLCDHVEKTYETPRNLTDTYIPNFNSENYNLGFTMNVSAIQDGWGRSTRVILGNVTLHFMKDALAVEGVKDGYDYSYLNEAKIGSQLNTDVPVSITVNGNKLSVKMSDVEVYTVETENVATNAGSPVKFSAWDATWTVSQYSITAIPASLAGFDFESDAPTAGLLIADGFMVTIIGSSDPLAENVLYYNYFGGTGYKGMSTDGEKTEFFLPSSYDRNYILEASVNISSIADGGGRGIKIVLGNCASASSGKTELWIGKAEIWACTSEWKNMQSFDITPYTNRNVLLRVIVENDSIELDINGVPVWQLCDDTFASATAANIGFGSWDANYTINNITVYSENALTLGTTYYVDAGAAEGGNGLTPETAWKTLAQVNLHGDFGMNDKLLFKKGCEWDNETLLLTGNGAKYHHVEVGSYGDGAAPIINRKGEFDPANGKWDSYAIKLTNGSYWTFKDIEIRNTNPVNPGTTEDLYINNGTAIAPMRGGLMVTASSNDAYAKNYFEINIYGIKIANIDCMSTDEHWRLSEIYDFNNFYAGAGGIAIRADQTNATVRYNGIYIQNCEGTDVGGTPISVESDWKATDSFNNLVIRNNRINSTPDHQVTGHGIYVVNAKNPVIEYNLLENLSNGIAVQVSNGALIQYNTVVGADGYMHYSSKVSGTAKYSDGCSYDVETNDEGEIILRNNISVGSHSGGFVAFDYTNNEGSVSANNAHTTIENNLSINDKIFFDYSGKNALYTFDVRNNTVYRYSASEYADYADVINVGVYAATGSVIFENNVLAYPGKTVNIFNSDDINYAGNVYYGATAPSEDATAIIADPTLVIPAESLITDFGYSYCGNINNTKNFYNTGYFKPESSRSVCIADGVQAKGAKLAEGYIAPVLGDANGDWQVDIKDIVRIKKAFAGESEECYRVSADVNSDGYMNSSDMVSVRKYLLGAIANFQ